MSYNYTSSDLQLIWDAYIDFEAFKREADGDLNYFIEKWKEKVGMAQSAGCQYSELLLGLKLMEKVNLSKESIHDVILKISSWDSKDLLTQVVTNIKEQSTIRGFAEILKKESASKPETQKDDQENSKDFESNSFSFPIKLVDEEGLDEDPVFNPNEKSRSNSGFVKCPICDKSFMLIENLEKHINNHGNSMFGSDEDFFDDKDGITFSKVGTEDRIEKKEKINNEIKNETIEESCHKNGVAENELSVHFKTNSAKIFQCNICQKEYKKFSGLKIHMDTHKATKDHVCPYCDKTFQTKQGLYDHKSRKHRQERNSSKEQPDCSTSLLADSSKKYSEEQNSKNIKKDRIKEEVKIEASVESALTNGQTDDSNSVEESKVEVRPKTQPESNLSIVSENKVPCETCGRYYAKTSMPNHLKTHTEEVYKCSVCEKEFNLARYLKVHMETHKSTKDHICSYCHKAHRTKQGLYKHLSKVHMKGKTDIKGIPDVKTPAVPKEKIPCEICRKFYAKDYMKIHMKTHTQEISGKYPCEICGRSIEGRCMNNHMRTHNQTHKAIECSICQKQFKDLCRLRIHMETHNTTKDYICSYCGKKFKTKSTLSEHLNMHTKAKPLPCSYCDKIFFSHSLRRFHIRAHHTGEKPYKCDFCDKRFYISTKKVQHMRYHTGEKPFQCHVCGKYFREYSTRKRHIRNVHKENKPTDV